MDGILNIYKEKGYTSFDVVAKLRGILKQKKIGHTGTLDPMAEGVLLVCLGKATKLVDIMTSKDKEYKAVMLLGYETDTEDVTGVKTTEGSTEVVSDEAIYAAINKFVGTYNQIPPMYSAIKKDGKKLYEYARAGIEIEREPREVTIYSIDNIEINLPEISFDVHCSKGTYIRSLCRDIGREIGTLATLKELERSEVNGYTTETALTLDKVSELVSKNKLEEKVIPMDEMLNKYLALHVTKEEEKYLRNGNKLAIEAFVERIELIDGMIVRVYFEDEFLALYEYIKAENLFKPYKMFL